ncbi:hypothetical protein HK096_002040 [Nowakowskiella sp. JEL0078]|nr:hypothetical protein HK096_002040 [Nowakowskiella sp. JEL0078]
MKHLKSTLLLVALSSWLPLLVESVCSDLPATVSFNSVCYNTVACSQATGTFTGSICGGSTTSTTYASYICVGTNVASTPFVTNLCTLLPLGNVNQCSSNVNYAVGTVTRVAFFTPDASTYCYLNVARTMVQTILFQAGSVNGIDASLYLASVSSATPSISGTANSIANDSGSNNTTIIVVAVCVAVVVVASAVGGFFIVRTLKKKRDANPVLAPQMQQQYATANLIPGSYSSTGSTNLNNSAYPYSNLSNNSNMPGVPPQNGVPVPVHVLNPSFPQTFPPSYHQNISTYNYVPENSINGFKE